MVGSLGAVLDEFNRIANTIREREPLAAAELDVATQILRQAFIPGAAPKETPPPVPNASASIPDTLGKSANVMAGAAKVNDTPIAKVPKPSP